MLQPAFHPFATIATARTPKYFPLLGSDNPTLGLTTENKIELFMPSKKAPTSVNNNVTDPDQLDLSAFSMQSAFDITKFGFSGPMASLYAKLEQLGLMYKLCKEAGLEPGSSSATDERIIALLKAALSDNITNQSAVIQEFIKLWNEIACLPEATAQRGQGPNISASERPIFISHPQYEATVNTLCKQMLRSVFQSEKCKSFFEKMMGSIIGNQSTPPDNAGWNDLIEMVLPISLHGMQHILFNPIPRNAIPTEELEQLQGAFQSIIDTTSTAAPNPAQLLSSIDTIASVSSRAESRLGRRFGYTPLHETRERDRDREHERDRTARSRSRSPIRGFSRDADKRDRSRDRTPPRSGY